MIKDWGYYKLIRYHVSLENAYLHSLECSRFNFEGELPDIKIDIARKLEVVSEKNIDIYLRVTLAFVDDGPYNLVVVYKGTCKKENDEIKEEEFENYASHQIVPLLLPYARECISSTLARMQLPIYTMPTMDVLESLIYNDTEQEG